MGMTITEKILARHAGRACVHPGENIWCDVDVLMSNDVIAPQMIGVFEDQFGPDAPVWDADRIVMIPDHYVFTADAKAHRNIDTMRDFVRRKGIRHHYDADFVPAGLEGMPLPYGDPGQTEYMGVCHVTLPQKGHTRPGELLLGTDSHTCTHGAFGEFSSGIGSTDGAFVMGTGKLWLKVPRSMKFVFSGPMPPYLMAKDLILHVIGEIGQDGATYCAMEVAGETVAGLNVDERMTICNMAIEAGGKNGIIHADEKTCDYVKARTDKPFEPQNGDLDAPVAMEKSYDVSSFVPCVAEPSLPSNYAPAGDRNDVKLTRAYIGSCTGGKITDFIMAAKILKGRKVSIDTFLVPATTTVAEGLMSETIDGVSLVEIFAEAGCLDIAPPSCAACLGGPADTFGRAQHEEVVISTTNRNFIGRMGSKQAQIYLASPLTAAASAVAGHITDPREMM